MPSLPLFKVLVLRFNFCAVLGQYTTLTFSRYQQCLLTASNQAQ